MRPGAAPCAAVVDPFDAGALYAPELRRRGYACVGVVSGPRIARSIRASARWRDFTAVRRHAHDAAATGAWLRARGVALVVAGCETGVNVADLLSARLGSPGNGVRLSRARRHKFLMAEAVRAHGLPVPLQACGRSLPALLRWIEAGAGYPVVVKPPHSLGFDGVHACATASEVEEAFRAILGRRNAAGLVNDDVLVQERLDGALYVVDTASRDGRHLLAGVWRYARPGAPPPAVLRRPTAQARSLLAYATIGTSGKQLCAPDTATARALFAYTCGVLDALAIRHGPAHCELAWTRDGPRLLEVGARLHGGRPTHLLSRLCTGASQLDRALDAYLDPDAFAAALARPYRLRRHAAVVRLTPRRTGTLRRFRRLAEVEALESFLATRDLTPAGRRVGKVVGLVLLAHRRADVVRRDVASIRELEGAGLYEIDP